MSKFAKVSIEKDERDRAAVFDLLADKRKFRWSDSRIGLALGVTRRNVARYRDEFCIHRRRSRQETGNPRQRSESALVELRTTAARIDTTDDPR